VNYKVQYGKSEITFDLDRRKRKTLAIHVYPDQHVEVVAPEDATIEKILAKVKKRSSWIFKKQREFSKIQPAQPKPSYESGETFRYLGKQYRLKTLEGNPAVKLKNGYFHLSTPPDSEPNKKEELLLSWFRDKGKKVFSERFQACIKTASIIGITEVPEWHIKAMPTRWGSCTKEGKIFLHPELIAAPKPCIDYVIYHELCHIIEHNHSSRFYTLLSKVYPDWKKWRDFLNENIEVRLV
jgi:predicted metal-dependent hydrolase